MKMMLLLGLSALVFSSSLMAQATNFEYPELMVTPKASERLNLQYDRENRRGVWEHLPMEVSALSTLVAGTFQLFDYNKDKDPDGYSPYVGILTGGFWMGVGFFMGEYYRPYARSLNELKKLPSSNQREVLMRERLAEEAIYNIEQLATKMVWASFATNLGASIYMVSKAEDKSAALVASSMSAVLSFAPVLFPHPWREAGEYHREYKKKIYRPIANAAVLYHSQSGTYVPGMQLALSF